MFIEVATPTGRLIATRYRARIMTHRIRPYARLNLTETKTRAGAEKFGDEGDARDTSDGVDILSMTKITQISVRTSLY